MDTTSPSTPNTIASGRRTWLRNVANVTISVCRALHARDASVAHRIEENQSWLLLIRCLAPGSFPGGPLLRRDAWKPALGNPWALALALTPTGLLAFAGLCVDDEPDRFQRWFPRVARSIGSRAFQPGSSNSAFMSHPCSGSESELFMTKPVNSRALLKHVKQLTRR